MTWLWCGASWSLAVASGWESSPRASRPLHRPMRCATWPASSAKGSSSVVRRLRLWRSAVRRHRLRKRPPTSGLRAECFRRRRPANVRRSAPEVLGLRLRPWVRDDGGVLLERTSQLAALDERLLSLGRLVFVVGEAGIGKTALVRAFCESHPEVRVLRIPRGSRITQRRPATARRCFATRRAPVSGRPPWGRIARRRLSLPVRCGLRPSRGTGRRCWSGGRTSAT
jgi:hypothetical protein